MQNQPVTSVGSHGRPRTSSTLQALVTVARRYGVDPSLEQLRRTYALESEEPPTEVIISIARDIGLEARSVRVKFRDLPRLAKALPGILRANDGSALILEGASVDPVKGAIAVLRDPADPGAAPMAIDEVRLADVWSGEIILVKRRHGGAEEQQPFGFGWLVQQLLRERKLLIDVAAATFVSTVFIVATPFVARIVFDRVLVNHSYSTLEVITGAVALLILFEMVLGHLKRLLLLTATTRIDGRLNLYIFEKLLRLPMDYFEHNATGMIVSKLNRLGHIRQFFTGQLLSAFIDLIPLLVLVPVLIYIEWRLSVFVFAMTGVIALIIMVCMRPIGERFRRVIRAEQKRGAHLVETIHGIRTVKSLAIEGLRRREWDARVATVVGARHELGVASNYPQTYTLPFERLMHVGSLLVGAYLILANPMSLSFGALIAFFILSSRLSHPLIQIARLQQDLAEVRGAISEVATVVNAPPEDRRESSGLRLPVKGQVTFQDVRFRYAPDAAYALDGITLRIPAGKMLGIVGRSGSGKTTLTRLLHGLHTQYEGIIKMDGMDLREMDLQHLRTNVGVVLQENFLFSGTIRENIGMASTDAPFAQIVRAAQLAGAEEFIERLPRGYDTMLEENGVNLSGGQRQRLAIARALLTNPPLLILDEATSSLDAESEAIVNANLHRMGTERTIICISHRLSMLVQSDAILVLERGKVYDIGTHDDLLQRCDIYKHLWYQQNAHVDRPAPKVLTHVERA